MFRNNTTAKVITLIALLALAMIVYLAFMKPIPQAVLVEKKEFVSTVLPSGATLSKVEVYTNREEALINETDSLQLLLTKQTSEVARLKSQMAKKGSVGSVVVTSVTKIDTVVKVISQDVVLDSIHFIIDTIRVKDKWYSLTVVKNKDSAKIDLLVNELYDVTFIEKSDGWFKPKKYEAQLLTYNPYTKVYGLQSSYEVPRKTKYWPSFVLGFSLGAVGGLIIK